MAEVIQLNWGLHQEIAGFAMLHLEDVRVVSQSVAIGPLTLTVKLRQWLGVVGPGNIGKSQLARVMAGLRQPDAGKRSLQITPETRLAWLEGRGLRYVPGDEPFDMSLSCGRLLSSHASLRGYDGKARKQALEQAAQRWNLDPIWDKKLYDLKRGVRRRIALAVAFLGAPRLLVLDDPFWGCDDMQMRVIREGLDQSVNTDVAVVLFSRSPRELATLATDMLELGPNGQVKFFGSWDAWVHRRAEPAVFKLVVRGPGGKIEQLLTRIPGVYEVLWHEGGEYNTFELRCDGAPKVREMVFRVLALKQLPIVELSREDNPNALAAAQAAQQAASGVAAQLKPKPKKAKVSGRQKPVTPEVAAAKAATESAQAATAADRREPPVPVPAPVPPPSTPSPTPTPDAVVVGAVPGVSDTTTSTPPVVPPQVQVPPHGSAAPPRPSPPKFLPPPPASRPTTTKLPPAPTPVVGLAEASAVSPVAPPTLPDAQTVATPVAPASASATATPSPTPLPPPTPPSPAVEFDTVPDMRADDEGVEEADFIPAGAAGGIDLGDAEELSEETAEHIVHEVEADFTPAGGAAERMSSDDAHDLAMLQALIAETETEISGDDNRPPMP